VCARRLSYSAIGVRGKRRQQRRNRRSLEHAQAAQCGKSDRFGPSAVQRSLCKRIHHFGAPRTSKERLGGADRGGGDGRVGVGNRAQRRIGRARVGDRFERPERRCARGRRRGRCCEGGQPLDGARTDHAQARDRRFAGELGFAELRHERVDFF